MSRTKKGKRSLGSEYWTRRPLSNCHGASPGKWTKTKTHRYERIEAKDEIKRQMKEEEKKGL